MKYTAEYKGKDVEFNFQETYEPLDFVRNNEEFDFFTKENGKVVIDISLVVRLMSECYRDMLEKNYI